MSSTVRAMVQVQLYSGCRPGEVIAFKTRDIDVTGRIWTASLTEHKTAHHDHARTIYFGPKVQDVLHVVMIRSALDKKISLGSGTIIKSDGERSLVITCRHLFVARDDTKISAGDITVIRQGGDKYTARLLGVHRNQDLSALEIADPGDAADLEICNTQPDHGVMAGYAAGNPHGDIRRGPYL
jgi:hypothetical protein